MSRAVSFPMKVKAAIARHDMLSGGDRVVVGVSGGPDSVALLNALHQWASGMCWDIVVAHLDHGVRRGSAADRRFVERLAARLGYPCVSRVLTREDRGRGASLENRLRQCRYDFFKETCRRVKARKIALAHTQDDRAETVLMRLLRGSGLSGLSAILPCRRWGDLTVIRPLIDVTKADVLRYLEKERLVYRTDVTNADDKFLRNKIRRRLLPLLEREYNPGIREVLAHLAETVGADYECLNESAQRLTDEAMLRRPGRRGLPLARLSAMPLSLRRLALRQMAAQVKGDLRKITFRHWREVEDLIGRRPIGSRVSLPDGVVAIKDKKHLWICQRPL